MEYRWSNFRQEEYEKSKRKGTGEDWERGNHKDKFRLFRDFRVQNSSLRLSIFAFVFVLRYDDWVGVMSKNVRIFCFLRVIS